MGYVEQNDIHTPALTVVESLEFSAHLRLDRDVNKRSEKNFVDNVRACQSILLDMHMSVENSNPAYCTPQHYSLVYLVAQHLQPCSMPQGIASCSVA